MPDPLDYDRDAPAHDARSRTVRLLWIVIAAKIVLVVVNTFLAFSTAPMPIKLVGVGVQVALTLAFLALILRLSVRR